MHPKEIEKVVSLEPLERYKYFIKKIADREFLFTLINENGEYPTSFVDDNELFPLWSDKDYVELCKVNGWENYSIKEISLEDLGGDLINLIAQSNYLLNVFPVYDKTGFIVDLAEFTRDLSEELENYE